MSLYLVTDSGLAGRDRIVDVVRAAVEGGVTVVQLREKNMDTRDFVQLAKDIKCVLHGIPLIINDRLDVALACDADGVHLGQSDMPCDIARSILGPDKIIGLSVENLSQTEQANALDVDYIGVSPVFSTPTKTDTAAPFGLEGLSRAVELSRHPVVAIGGINASNASQIMSCGADGIAVVSAIVCAPNPRLAASNLSKLVKV